MYIRTDNDDKNIISKDYFTKHSFSKFKVDLGYYEFEKEFDVYCSNKIFAMQLLTADVMQTLLDFKVKFLTNFEITIKDNAIFIRIFRNFAYLVPDINNHSETKEFLQLYYNTLKYTFDLSSTLKNLLDEIDYNN